MIEEGLIERLLAMDGAPGGVLSVYVDADPSRQAGRHPQWEVVLRDRLRALREEVREREPHERWTAIHRRLDELAPVVDDLVGQVGQGRGRALFAAIGDDRVETVRLQASLPDLVTLGPRPHLAPLLAALERGRPAGLVAASRDEVRIVDWRDRRAQEVGSLTFSEDTGDWREMRGTSGSNPALTRAGGGAGGGGPSTGAMYQQSGAAQRDRFDRRLEEHRARFAAAAARTVADHAARRGWATLVVAGDPRITAPLREALPSDLADDVVEVEEVLQWRRPQEFGEAAEERLDERRRERERRLVEEARVRAVSGGRGALGVDDVMGALVEGRVETLLFDPRQEVSGVVAPDGRAVLASEALPGVPPEELTPEPDLIGLMVVRALASKAEVVPVSGEAAEALEAIGEPVAAILRW